MIRSLFATMVVLGFLAGQAAAKPNIVLFFVDDLGWTDLGYRNKVFESPNIDRLAAESLDFEQAYVASPTCSPSRATLVTGKHPARLKIVRYIPTGAKHPAFDQYGRTTEEFNLLPDDPAQFPCRNWLPLDHITYAEALGELGYYNFFAGKWHLGHEDYHPIKQGFDKQFGTTNWGHPKSYRPPFFRYTHVLADEKDTYLTDRLTDETVRFINDYDQDKPFMVFALVLLRSQTARRPFGSGQVFRVQRSRRCARALRRHDQVGR